MAGAVDDVSAILADPTVRGRLMLGGLVFARLTPLVAFSPLFGGPVLPRRLRTGLILLLTVSLSASMPTRAVGDVAYVGLIVKELVVGLFIAVTVSLTFEAFTAGGALIDLSRGATLSGVMDPLHGNQSSPLGAFYGYLAVTIFIAAGGYAIMVSTLADSFVLLPAYDVAPGALLDGASLAAFASLAQGLLVVAVKIAAPVVVLLLLLDVALGLINRLASRVDVFFLGMPAKAWLGILIAFLSIGVVMEIGRTHLSGMVRTVGERMRTISGK